MSSVDAGIVFLPRFTTLVGQTDFLTAPLDVSRQGGIQFQVWRGPIRTSSGTGEMNLLLEESFDAVTWALGPSTAQAYTLLEDTPHFFSYSFRLRWFRLKFTLAGTNPMVSCWAEGLLRGGDGGMWGSYAPTIGPAGALGYDPLTGGAYQRPPETFDPWEQLRWALSHRDDPAYSWVNAQIPKLFEDARQKAEDRRREDPTAYIPPAPNLWPAGHGGSEAGVFGDRMTSTDLILRNK